MRTGTGYGCGVLVYGRPVAVEIHTVASPWPVVNSVPPDVPISLASSLAVTALDHAYSIGFAICGVAAFVCCAVTVLMFGGRSEQEEEIAMIESGPAVVAAEG